MSSDKGKNSNNALANLPIINRLKNIKDLFIKKLDQTYSKISQINKTSVQINKAINVLLENDSSLLEASINIVEALQITRQQNQVIIDILKSSRIKLIRDESNSDPETRLMAYLYSYLPNRFALDIGANVGNISEQLLQAGYEVYAFEPFPPVFEKLSQRLSNNSYFHCYSFAIGSADEVRDLNIALDETQTKVYQDSTLYNSLVKHSFSEGLTFTHTVPVTVRTLESLHDASEIPTNIGLVKIDTEGFDLEVMRGMGCYTYPVVVAEFWDSKFPFGHYGAMNNLEDMVNEMKAKNYHWYIVIYRIWGIDQIYFYCNYPHSIENSWGNVFFFQDYQVFNQAMMWCSSVMPATYFSA